MTRAACFLVLAACARATTPAPPDSAPPPPAPPPPSAPAAPIADAAPDVAPPRVTRPVVFHAFRYAAEDRKVDRVSPRKPEPDGEKDLVFELAIEGDFTDLVVWDGTSAFAATTTRVELAPRSPPVTGPLPVPKLTKPPPFAITKHFPVLFAFEGDALVAYEGSHLALSDREGRRTLRLHTYALASGRAMHVYAELPDGTYKEGPPIR